MNRKWMVLSNTTLAVLMSTIDGNSIVIALPSIGRDLADTSALDIVWMVIGYQLVAGSILVNLGRFADLFGRVRLYKLGYVTLTVGSALCSLAQTGLELVAFRVLQGAGAALIQANSTALIMDAFPPNERGKALGINAVALSSGMILGLVLGGALTTLLGWRSIFWINIPIGLFSIVWSHVYLKELRKLPVKPRFDITGNLTFLAGLLMFIAGATLYALGLLEESIFLALSFGGIASMLLFVYAETHLSSPMLNLKLFRIRAFAVGNTVSMINSIGQGTIQLVLTFYLQGPTMGLIPLIASFYLLPSAFANIIAGPLSGYLTDKHGPRLFTLLGTSMSCVGCLLLAQLQAVTSFTGLAIPLLVMGFGNGIFGTPNRTQVVGAVKAEDRGVATGVFMTMMNVGGVVSRGVTFLVMGIVLPATVLQAVFAGNNSAITAALAGQFIDAMHLVFYFAAVLSAVSVILCALWFAGIIKDRTAEEEFGKPGPSQQGGPKEEKVPPSPRDEVARPEPAMARDVTTEKPGSVEGPSAEGSVPSEA